MHNVPFKQHAGPQLPPLLASMHTCSERRLQRQLPHGFFAMRRMDENAVTEYFCATPLLPPTVKSLGAGRLVSTRRHH